MFEGTRARTIVALLAAVLLALHFLTPSASFASAHTSRDAVAKAAPGFDPSGTAPRGETVTCHDAGKPGSPNGSPRLRDRHRAAAPSAPETPERPLARRHAETPPERAASGSAHRHPSRSSTTHSPAALQVFRC
ncbi:hypothetical protein GCM10010377_07070 [Streptomyces viridiviolaceus]|uniref:Secreted protein n=1 Tax=Streptomyces viridiviolaceus TaxID=68282 RepID=A0ABW2E3T8_9ACTN|nr:hypothetical protein [Streptomyces viridiviolaceus]GHB19735.1 hypothetical protein GCM10010377_07070 [Streptomyces viridiviolaceus]